jgi:hypothetical protein
MQAGPLGSGSGRPGAAAARSLRCKAEAAAGPPLRVPPLSLPELTGWCPSRSPLAARDSEETLGGSAPSRAERGPERGGRGLVSLSSA